MKYKVKTDNKKGFELKKNIYKPEYGIKLWFERICGDLTTGVNSERSANYLDMKPHPICIVSANCRRLSLIQHRVMTI